MGSKNNTISNSKTASGLARVVSALERLFPAVRWLFYIAAGVLAVYTCFVVVDVVSRYVFNSPFRKSSDIGGSLMTVFLFLAAGYTQIEKAHVEIDMITAKLPRKTKMVLSTAMYIICLVVTAVIVWRSAVNTIAYYKLGTKSQSGLLLFPSAAMVPIGGFFLFIVYLRDVLSKLRDLIELRAGTVALLLSIIAPLLFMTMAALSMLHVFPGLNTDVMGYISIILLFVFMFMGMPLAMAFVLFSVVLMGISTSTMSGLMLAGKTLYTQAADYNWTVIPLFTLMSYLFMESGMGTKAYKAAYIWCGGHRGGLALATIVACTAFASVNGGPLPAIVIMGTVGLTEMRKYKYSDALSTGSILAGSTLGPMIPPSVPFIIYGIICRESIGRLFIAGIIPGVMLAISFIIVILLIVRINPKAGPAGEKSTRAEKIKTLPHFLPIIILFIIVIGGIYAGIFSTMEAGGIGAFGAFVIALTSGDFTWKKFASSLLESAKTNSMLLILVITGLIFGNALAGSGLSIKLVEATKAIGVHPLIFTGSILIIYMIFGIVCDEPILLLITLPILSPIAKGLGIDMIWFGVMVTLIANVGAITPPFAMGMFMLKNIGPKDLTLESMFRGSVPFFIASWVVALIIMFIPELVTWLPNLMMK